jgi:hypothetical protein
MPDILKTLLYDSSSNSLFFSILSSPKQETGFNIPSILFRTDLNGNIERELIDTIHNGNLSYTTVASSRDGQFLYWGGGAFETTGDRKRSYVLMKTDKELNVMWRKFYSINAVEGFYMTIRTTSVDDNLSVLCNRVSFAGNDLGLPVLPERIYIRVIDSAGNVLIEHTPGDTCTPREMVISKSGEYVVVGRPLNWGYEGPMFLQKTDTMGNENWKLLHLQDYETSYPSELVIVMSKEQAESYVIAGQTVPPNCSVGFGFAVKMDKHGSELWRKTFGRDNSLHHSFWAVANSNDYGSVMAGATSTLKRGSSAPHGWLVRIDKDGNEIWNRTVTAFPRLNDDEYLYKVVALPDGGFVAGGTSQQQNINGRWNQDAWLVRVDSNGCVDPECSGDLLSIKGTHKNDLNFNFYPNPARDYVRVENSVPFPAETTVSLYDNLGRKLKVMKVASGQRSMQYNLSGLPSGLYHIQIGSKGQYVRKKLTVVK